MRPAILPTFVLPGIVCALVWALAPARVTAQVAVTTLVPVSPNITGSPHALSAGFVTLNPAAMQWGAPSRFGIGYGEGEIEPEGGELTDFDGTFGGGRLVGERFSAAAEGVNISDNDGPLDFYFNTTTAALGVRVLSPLSVGALYSTAKSRDAFVESDVTSWSVGGSYRLGEWLFAGGSYGLDTIEVKDTSDPLVDVQYDDDRSVFVYGAGVRFGGSFRVHLEGYAVDRNAYEYQGTKFGDSKTAAAVAELGWGPIVVGGKWITSTEDVSGLDYTTRTQIYDVAWAPLLGLALGVHFESSEEKVEDLEGKTDIQLTALTLAYQF